jgi:hypothetical protein
MLPRLKAEEALHQVGVLQAASADYEQHARQRIVQMWERDAMQGREVARASSIAEIQTRLALAGIGVTIVKPEHPSE